MSLTPVIIALGSNLGDRPWHLRRALTALGGCVRLVRLSSVHDTTPVDAPPGSRSFLNMVVVGLTQLTAPGLMRELLAIESRLGRIRTTRNAPRIIDLDLIFYGAVLERSALLTLPHPRYRKREFVLAPLRELHLPWHDPQTQQPFRSL